MTEIWIYKADGTIQCVPRDETEISLSEMRKQLELLIGAQNILGEEKRGPINPVPAVCGMLTGNVNAYKITPEGLNLLFSRVAGPSGFDVDPNTKILVDPDHPIVPWPTKKLAGDNPIFPWPTRTDSLSDDRFVPWPWVALAGDSSEGTSKAFLNVVSTLTQVGSLPTHIGELLGRKCRVYNEGDVVTLDFQQQRVNIVLDHGNISRISFG